MEDPIRAAAKAGLVICAACQATAPQITTGPTWLPPGWTFADEREWCPRHPAATGEASDAGTRAAMRIEIHYVTDLEAGEIHDDDLWRYFWTRAFVASEREVGADEELPVLVKFAADPKAQGIWYVKADGSRRR